MCRVSQKSHSWEGHLQISGLIPAQSNFKLGCSEPSPVNLLKSARAAISQPLWTPAATPAPTRTFFLHIPGVSLADSCTFSGHPWRAWHCLVITPLGKTAQRSSPPFSSSPYTMCSSPSAMALCWTSLSPPLPYWGAHNRTQHCWCVSSVPSRGGGWLPLTCWWSSYCSPAQR